MNTTKKLAVLIGAGALLLAVSGTAVASPTWATISSYPTYVGGSQNDAAWWNTHFDVTDCTKIDSPSGATWTADVNYAHVIVKTASNASVDAPLTEFDNVSAGQTVWADTDKDWDTAYDAGADKDSISHIITCGPSETTTTTTDTFTSTVASSTDTTTTTTDTDTTTTTTDTFTGSVNSTTDSQPPTDTIGSTGSGQQSGGMWLLIAGLGMLLGSVIVLAPAKTRK